MKLALIILSAFLLHSCNSAKDTPETIHINNNWQFKSIKDSVWKTATIPGNIHTDLLDHNIIKNPFIGNNEADVQWVTNTSWEYKTKLILNKNTLNKKHLELDFKGLDTYAFIYLNDSLILTTNNAFKTYQVDVKKSLKIKNELKIVLKNTDSIEAIIKEKQSYQLPEGNRIFTRKAQFQYGWDWGPKLNTSGIWRPVILTAYNDLKIEDLYIQQNVLNKNNAKITVNLKSKSALKEPITYHVFINDSLYKTTTGKLNQSIPIDIKTPKLWWPHNLGEPYLYHFKILAKNKHKLLDSITIKKGLRTINLVNKKDSIGESFYFKVNNVPVYAKGANYIPQHSFQNKVSNNHYEKLLNNVVAANMNMLRVWGGGIYENDIFYNLCDEKGLLVWQDFMFACAMYPGDNAFLENVTIEAEQNVKRLRNHASVALWCGNNESAEGWKRWGWQADRTETEKTDIWNDYLKIFDSILPQTVEKFSDTDYWETSPKYGRGNSKYKSEGDAHDWWIWHDAYPFEHLEDNVPRFMSEFGFQSFPSYEAIKYINQSDSINITSNSFKNHQKHGRGFDLINNYMQRDFPAPTTDEDYVYMSQLLQAYGMNKGFEAQRREKPYNMGTLYWQLNDCWPVISWSSIDFMGNWKALHYKVKDAFRNILISNKIKNNTIKTYVINDSLSKIKGQLKLEIKTLKGKPIWHTNKDITALPLSSKCESIFNYNNLKFNKNNAVLITYFNNKTYLNYFVKPKNLSLNKTNPIHIKTSKTTEGFTIELNSISLQKDVFLYTNNKGHFSRNFFDMLPNKTYHITFTTNAKTLADLKYKRLNDFVD